MQQPSVIRVMTVDDLALIHSGVRLFLAPFADFELVCEAYGPADAVRLAEQHRPDVVLLEIAAAGEEWPDLIRWLAGSDAATRVLVLTTAASGPQVRAAFTAGACGYLLKALDPISLAQAIRGAMTGQQVIGPEASMALIAPEPDADDCVVLSPREREVLALLACGLPNREIAARLFLSVSTVKFHVGTILGKLGARSRSEAIVRAYEHALLPCRGAHDVAAPQPRRGAYVEAVALRV